MPDETRLSGMLNAVPIPVAYFDAEFVCRGLNAAAAVLFDTPAESALGTSIDDLPPWCPGFADDVRSAFADGASISGPPVARAGGPKAGGHHLVTFTPRFDHDGSVAGVVTADVDATDLVAARTDLQTVQEDLARLSVDLQSSNEQLASTNEDLISTNEELLRSNEELDLARRRVSEELGEVGRLVSALAEQRDTLEAIMENTPETGLVYLDADFNFVRVNSTYVKGCQMAKEELIGRNHFDLFPNAENEAIFKRVLASGQPAEYRAKPFFYAYQPWRGTTYWDWTLTPIKDPDHVVQGLVLSLVDVTNGVRRAQLSEALTRLDDVIHSTLDTSAIMERVLVETVEATGCEAAAILSREGDTWSVAYVSDGLAGFSGRALKDSPILEQVVATRQAVVLDDATSDKRMHRSVTEFGIKNFLDVPLLMGGEIVGVLGLHYLTEPVPFSEPVVDFATRLAASLSLALANNDLWESEVSARKKAAAELQLSGALLRAAGALARWDDLGELLGSLSDVLLESIDRRRAGVYLWDPERRELEAVAHGGHRPVPTGTVVGVADVSTGARRVLDTGKSEVIDYDALSPLEKGLDLEHSCGLGLVVPLMYRGRLQALVAIDDEGGRREYSARDIAVVEGIAAEAAVAIENARRYAREREAARLRESLNRILTTFISARDPEDILHDIVEETMRATGADYALISSVKDGEWRAANVFGEGGEARAATRVPFEDRPVLADAFTTRTIQLVEDAMGTPRSNKEITIEFGIRSFAAVPLILHNEVLGVLELVYTSRAKRFDAETLEFLERLMVDASVALDKAMEHDWRRRIAETLQEGLLALPEHLPGMAFAHTYHSATEASLVGGDFYDLFELDDGLIGITIGDISGKGLDAAVLTSLVKNTIRAHAIEKGKTPSGIVGFANTILLRGSPTEVFATVFFGTLDRLTGHLEYCNAAHTAGAIVRPDGALTALPANSPLVGAYEDVVFCDSAAELGTDDLLFLYTDGLIEAREHGNLYGEDRLFECLREARDDELGEICRKCVGGAVEFGGGRLADDVATLALRRVDWALPLV